MTEQENSDPFDKVPASKGYPRRDEPKLEDLPSEWQEEDRKIEGRTPDLGEIEEDPSED